jgi:hypothetical protein
MDDYQDRIAHNIAKAGTGCIVGAFTAVFAYLLHAPLAYLLTKPRYPEDILRKQKIPPVWGALMEGVACAGCKSLNDNDQVLCYHCGMYLGRGAATADSGVAFPVNNTVGLFLLCFGIFFVGLVMTKGESGLTQTIGGFMIIGGILWAIRLIFGHFQKAEEAL